jgi:NAD(P)-dependent dehydrogenase (short-subunit alcohol dehydrogenase family)
MATNPVVIVFGAAAMGSIGHAAAVQAARDGASVVVADIDRPKDWIPDVERDASWKGLPSVASEIESLGGRATAIQCDVRRRDQIQALVRCAEELGTITGMVNTTRAPIARAVPAIDEDPDYWSLSFDVNVTGALLCASAVARSMMKAGKGGSIVNISSVAGLHPVHGRTAYCASKAALHMLTRCLALDLAPSGIRVNAVLAGIVSTNRVDPEERELAEAMGVTLAEQRRQLLEAQGGTIPLGRVGRPEEIAAAVAFLLSDASSYITGELISVAGGAYAPHGSAAPVEAGRSLLRKH